MESHPPLLARIGDFAFAVLSNWRVLVAVAFLISGPFISGPLLQLLPPNIFKKIDEVLSRARRLTLLRALCVTLLFIAIFNTYDDMYLRLLYMEESAPLLHVKPSIIDSFISWKNGNLTPYPEHGGDPFAITIKNIGIRNAINITITFSWNINADELARMALNSDLFSGRNIQGDAKKLAVPLRFGEQSSAASITLTGENLRKRDEIPAQGPANEITVSYPSGIKDEISLWLLITSHSRGRAWMAEEEKEAKVIGDPNLSIASRMELINDQIQKRQRAQILILPDLQITISYQDTQKARTYTIRSIYTYMSSAEWVTGIEPETLSLGNLVKAWLDSNRIPNEPGDYSVGIPQDGDERILTWNVKKLREQPTIAQLQSMAPFARSRQQVLMGGSGILSYEDQDNPSEGFFNIYKNQGIFTPRTG